MAQGPYLRKYGVETIIHFHLFEVDGVDLRTDAAHAKGDTIIMKNEGAEANTSNGFVDEGLGYSITLDSGEMTTARIVVYVIDQSTKQWLDTVINIETYGNASAQHAFDLDTAMASQTVGTTTTNTDMRGTDNAALASVLGALNNVAADGDPTDADTIMQYAKQLINVLVGSAGIVAFPAEAAPANAVSLAEVIRAIHADTGTTLDTLIKDIPTTAEIALRTLLAADYTIVADLGTVQTGDSFARIGALGVGLTAVPWNSAWDTEVQSEVADALDAAMPGAPTADSINQYIQQLKWVLVNKMAITEANGNTVGYKDDGIAEAYSIAAAFVTAAGTTTRKRLEP